MDRGKSSAPSAGTCALLAAGFLAFAVYGSLVPLQFQLLTWNEAVARFGVVCARPVRVESLSDWLTNILLFIPLGFLLMAAGCVDKSEKRGLTAALIVLPFCTLLSTGIEFAQLWLPARVSSLNDIVAESLGGLLGILAWLLAGRRVTAWLRETWRRLDGRGWAVRLLPAYLVVLLIVHTLPFDLTLRPAELYHKYRDGRVQLLPFASGSDTPWLAVAKQLSNVLWFLPVGVLLAHWRGTESRADGRRMLLIAVLIAGGVEFAQFFVASRNCDSSDVITGTLAVLGGWAAGRGALPAPRLRGLTLGLFGWLAVLAIINWQPFDFTGDGPFLCRRLETLSLVPFADYQRAAILQAFDQFLTKAVLWIPAGALAALRFADTRPGRALLPVLCAALVIEAGQFFLPDRCASITDVLLETGGAALGLLLVRRAQYVPSDVVRPGRKHGYCG